MILMESYYYYYLLSISFGYVFCLQMLCIKVYRKTSVGEAHHDYITKFDRENHEIQKAMDQKPHSPKLDRNGPESGPPGFLHGPAGPPQLSCPKTPILGCDLKTLKTNQNIFTIF